MSESGSEKPPRGKTLPVNEAHEESERNPMRDKQDTKRKTERLYLEAGKFIESEKVPKDLWGATIVVTCRGDVSQYRRFAIVDSTGAKIPNVHGQGMFFDSPNYELFIERGLVNLDGVDIDAVRAAAEATGEAPSLTCDGMDRVATIEVRQGLYHDQQSEQFYWDDAGTAKVAPWQDVAHHLAIGDLMYEEEGDEKRLLELLRDCEQQSEQQRRHQPTESEEADEPEEGRPGRLVSALAMLALGIAAGYGLALALSR